MSGNFIGAQVDTYSGGAEPTGLHFNNNSFTGSSVKEFINNTAVTTDISNNYWGTAVATTVASKISGLVSFDPYYVDSAKTILSSTVPFAVYVDDNYSDGFSGSYYFGYNAFATIQEGVDAVAANGTVNVAAGGYTENLIVNKSLTIKGVGDTAIIDGNINATGDNVTIQSLKIINSNSHDGGVSDYGVKATAGKALTLETVTVDVLHDAISMTGDSTLNNTALTINNSTIKGYGALVISGAIKSAGNKNAVVTIHDTSLTGTTSYSGSSDDFSVIGTNNTKNVNINFTGTNSVTNEYTNDAQAKERLISFYNSNNITVTGLPIYTNAGNSKVSTDALFVSAYGPYTNTVQGRNVARYVSNTTEFESALASSATTPIVVGRYETDINTTAGTKTLKTGVTLIIEDHTPVTISNGTTLINNGTIIIESGASLINNGTLQSISITGDAKYGQLLTAAVTGITNAGTPAYQWKRDGADISGATTATYTVVTDDIGKVITATATTVSGITGTGSITSAGTGAVTKADQTTLVAVATPSTVVYGSTSALTAIGGSGTGAVTYSVGDSSGCSVTDSTLSVTNANGSCAVTATKATDANYNSATSGALAVTLQKAGQTITFGSLSGKTYGDTNFDVAATTDSSLSTTFSVGGSDNCTISGATVSITGAGSCTVTAHQVGSDNYSSAPDVAQTFSIATKAITITAVADNKGFGLTDPLFTYTVTGTLVGNDVFTGSLARVAGETLGTYAINQGTLALNTNYTITYVSALFTIKDITAPTILSSYAPSSNAVGVDPTGNISIPFSEAVNIVSGDITLTTGGSPVEFAIEGNGTANIVVNPGATLSNNSTYIVTVKITTADLAGNHLASEKSWTFTTAGSYSFTLSNGWNLVALGVVPNNNSVSTILGSSSTNVESIWSYDAVANTWSVNHPNDGADTDTLSSMTAGNGYWVNYIGASSVTLSGSGNLFLAGENTPPSRTLKAGWNLIGYYQRESNTTAVVTNALKTLKSQDATPIPWWSMIVKHDNSAKQFGTVENSNFLSSGQGYWILMGGRATDTYIYAPGITDL
ncbi:MAG: Ig-like domain-containing protein [bacterium]|nr:Ig-like domain-containing protein [bacterium]